jgi:hypothetical protein
VTIDTGGVGSGDLTITDTTAGDVFGGGGTASDTNAALVAETGSFTVQFGSGTAQTIDLSSTSLG